MTHTEQLTPHVKQCLRCGAILHTSETHRCTITRLMGDDGERTYHYEAKRIERGNWTARDLSPHTREEKTGLTKAEARKQLIEWGANKVWEHC